MIVDGHVDLIADFGNAIELAHHVTGDGFVVLINKVDREGLSPFALLDEIADVLALDVCPMS